MIFIYVKTINMTSLYHSFFNIYKLTHFKFKGKILTYSHRATTFLVVLSGSMFLSLWMKFYRSKTFLLNWRAELAFRNVFFFMLSKAVLTFVSTDRLTYFWIATTEFSNIS